MTNLLWCPIGDTIPSILSGHELVLKQDTLLTRSMVVFFWYFVRVVYFVRLHMVYSSIGIGQNSYFLVDTIHTAHIAFSKHLTISNILSRIRREDHLDGHNNHHHHHQQYRIKIRPLIMGYET